MPSNLFTPLDWTKLSLFLIYLSRSFVKTSIGRALSPWCLLFRSLHRTYRVAWNAYWRQNRFFFSIVGRVINRTISTHRVEKDLWRIPFVSSSQTWEENEHSKKRWFLVSEAVLHSTQVVTTPWFQQEILSIVDNLSLIASQAMKANFGVACENQMLFYYAKPYEHVMDSCL